jgi:hypothetical protein
LSLQPPKIKKIDGVLVENCSFGVSEYSSRDKEDRAYRIDRSIKRTDKGDRSIIKARTNSSDTDKQPSFPLMLVRHLTVIHKEDVILMQSKEKSELISSFEF